MITTNNRIEGRKPSGLMFPPRLKIVGHQTRNCKNKRPATGSNLQPVSHSTNSLDTTYDIEMANGDLFRHRHWYGLLSKYHAKIFCDEKVVHILIDGETLIIRECVIRFGKRRKLNPRYIGPFRILKRVNPVAFTLKLPEELKLRLDDKLNFVEEPVEIMDREVKQLKQSRIPIVKVRWNSKRGPEFTWECEDQIRAKYPHLFSNITPIFN
ncbi:hypothetical protein Tco_0824688 [Tanacetum coccineum]|uniref:Tf2-1-like SH3-like domain-containing protein n=1 Tax=Tanacetum coccineum TaxID=301880 RepID=A0ABQ5ARH4_9ASTR